MSTVLGFLAAFGFIVGVAALVRWGWQQDRDPVKEAMKHVDDFIREVLGKGNGNDK